MASRKTYLRFITLGVVALTVAVWTARRPEALIVIGGMPTHWGPLGLARGQALRFYLANAAMEGPDCDADVTVYDMMGMEVARSSLMAMAGETDFFDVFFDTDMFSASRKDNKVVLRLVVDLQDPPDPGTDPGGVIGTDPGTCIETAEVYDTRTGKIEVFIDNPDLLPAP